MDGFLMQLYSENVGQSQQICVGNVESILAPVLPERRRKLLARFK